MLKHITPVMVEYPWYDFDLMGGLDYCTVASNTVISINLLAFY